MKIPKAAEIISLMNIDVSKLPKVSEEERMENLLALKQKAKVEKIFSRIVKESCSKGITKLPNYWFQKQFEGHSDKAIDLAWYSKNASDSFSSANRNVPDYKERQHNAHFQSRILEGAYISLKNKEGKRIIDRGELLSHIKSHLEGEIVDAICSKERFRQKHWAVKAVYYLFSSIAYGWLAFAALLVLFILFGILWMAISTPFR